VQIVVVFLLLVVAFLLNGGSQQHFSFANEQQHVPVVLIPPDGHQGHVGTSSN